MRNSKIDQNSAIYKRAVAREGKFWKGRADDPVNMTHMPQPLVEYRKECETGDAKKDRYEHLKSMGPFKKGLSIGCGAAKIEIELLKQGIVKEFTFIDISEESLKGLQASLSPALRKRTKILRQDMNFIELNEKYDFIFCSNVLHHLINLEHIFLEMNNSLTPEGILVIDDYIGENRFQFTDSRIKLINSIAKEASKKTGVHHKELIRTGRKSLINSCPFEAIRAEDIHPLLQKLHGKYTVQETCYGGVSAWMGVVIDLQTKSEKERKKIDDAAKLFIAQDRKYRKKIPQLFLFGIYKKNPKPPVWKVKMWTKKELAHHLPVSIFDEGIVFKIGDKLRGAIGEGRVYTMLKKLYLKMRS